MRLPYRVISMVLSSVTYSYRIFYVIEIINVHVNGAKITVQILTTKFKSILSTLTEDFIITEIDKSTDVSFVYKCTFLKKFWFISQ